MIYRAPLLIAIRHSRKNGITHGHRNGGYREFPLFPINHYIAFTKIIELASLPFPVLVL